MVQCGYIHLLRHKNKFYLCLVGIKCVEIFTLKLRISFTENTLLRFYCVLLMLFFPILKMYKYSALYNCYCI